MTATARRTYTRVCRICGDSFEAGKPWGKVCKKVECQRATWREQTGSWMAAHPGYRTLAQRRYIAAHRAQWQTIQRNWRRRPCPNCGKLTWKRTPLVPALCRQCADEAKKVTRFCDWCGVAVKRRASDAFPKAYCPDHLGILTKIGKEYGVTRERIRQLTNKQVLDTLRQTGENITKQQAWSLVAKKRRPMKTPPSEVT